MKVNPVIIAMTQQHRQMQGAYPKILSRTIPKKSQNDTLVISTTYIRNRRNLRLITTTMGTNNSYVNLCRYMHKYDTSSDLRKGCKYLLRSRGKSGLAA